MTDIPTPASEAPPRVFLDVAALEIITAETRTAATHLETGGILLGQGNGRPNFHVMRAGTPGPNALHEPTRFLRDLEHATALAEQAWDEAQAVWIGEWHTHPVAGAVPSETDLRSYVRHLLDPDLGFERFLSLIVAATGGGATSHADHGSGADRGAALAAWVIAPGQAVLAELIVLNAGKGTHD